MRQPATDLLLPALGLSAALHLGVLFGVQLAVPAQSVAPQPLEAQLQAPATPVYAPSTANTSHPRITAMRRMASGEAAIVIAPSPLAPSPVTTGMETAPIAQPAIPEHKEQQIALAFPVQQHAPAAPDMIYYPVEQLDVPPHLLGDMQQVYPARARTAEIEGTITLSLLINERGGVDEVGVVQAQPQGYFEAAAVDMLRVQNFTPAIKQGRAVKSRWLTKVRYRLQG
ncbi:MAG: TonB family protein [Nitrosomonadales bacterium]|nr:TonB family protein [Nitrosomonadales bacterium]